MSATEPDGTVRPAETELGPGTGMGGGCGFGFGQRLGARRRDRPAETELGRFMGSVARPARVTAPHGFGGAAGEVSRLEAERPNKKPPPGWPGGGSEAAAVGPRYSKVMITTARRFCARPAAVSFDATGSAEPRPSVRMRLGSMPWLWTR